MDAFDKMRYPNGQPKGLSVEHPTNFIRIKGNQVTFQIQDGPIGESGVNGCQATDMLIFVKELYKSLNNKFACRENALTITKLEEAIHWQEARTKDRENRGVEGKSEE